MMSGAGLGQKEGKYIATLCSIEAKENLPGLGEWAAVGSNVRHLSAISKSQLKAAYPSTQGQSSSSGSAAALGF